MKVEGKGEKEDVILHLECFFQAMKVTKNYQVEKGRFMSPLLTVINTSKSH